MKRRLLIIAVFLLLGAVVNVAVAWERALFVNRDSHAYSTNLPANQIHTYLGAFDSSLGATEMILVTKRPRCGYTDVYLYANTGPGPGQWALIYRVDTGLPLRTMRCEVHPGNDERGVLRLGFLPSRFNKRRVPTQPIWPAFAANTIFYATLLWLLIPGPFALRRFLRLRRGLCPKCAYPIGESAVCTECGRALP